MEGDRKNHVGIVWDSFGPYHHARLAAVRARLSRWTVRGIQIAGRTSTYGWNANSGDVETLFPTGLAEDSGSRRIFLAFRALLRQRQFAAVFLPSYWPARSTALLLAASAMRVPVIMMNESHAGTESSTLARKLAKRMLVRLFRGGLVGGSPHLRYFSGIGLRADRLFSGYDAVDNRHFQTCALKVRAKADEVRARLGLPHRYILNIGRMVPKKNLARLIHAYALLARRWNAEDGIIPGLVLVGSGEEETSLRTLCSREGLPNIEVSDEKFLGPAVYFHGFRQVDELPDFYALADVFVLPSVREEWGLVVNEAMASGSPVLVSRTAGCAEDLVAEGENGFTFEPGHSEELAGKLRSILLDSGLREQMGRRSEEIISRWGCDNFALQAERVLEACGIGGG